MKNLTIEAWLDTGFDNWHKEFFRFNRVYLNMESNGQLPDDIPDSIRFLKSTIENQTGLIQTNKILDRGGKEAYYADFFTPIAGFNLQLGEIHQMLRSPNRIEGHVCLNDLLVMKGHARYRYRGPRPDSQTEESA